MRSMDAMELPMKMASIAFLLLVLVLNTQHMLIVVESTSDEEVIDIVDIVPVVVDGSALLDAKGVSQEAMHH